MRTSDRLARFVPGTRATSALVVVFLGLAAAIVVLILMAEAAGAVHGAGDYVLYMARARSWLAGDGFYLAGQVTGQVYPIEFGDVVYPPVVLWLLVPFTWLPAALWWVLPIGLLALAVAWLRPSAWGRVAMAAILAYPRTWDLMLAGNPAMWSLAFLTAGFCWGWPGPFVAMKLTLAPFAFATVRRPGWLIGAAVALLMCLPFGAMWLDFSSALLNAHGSGALFGPAYVVADWPIALALVFVGLTGRRPVGRHPDHGGPGPQ